MPWCPKCRTEYRQGVSTCVDCESELVPELENIIEDNNYVDDIEAFLVTASNNIEAEMLEALLQNQNIPVLKKFRGAGDYLRIYMGRTNYGIDLYVPSKLLDKAKAGIEGMLEGVKDNNLGVAEEVYPDDGEMQIGDDGEIYTDKEEQQNLEDMQQSYGKPRLSKFVVFIYILLLFFAGSILYNIYKVIF